MGEYHHREGSVPSELDRRRVRRGGGGVEIVSRRCRVARAKMTDRLAHRTSRVVPSLCRIRQLGGGAHGLGNRVVETLDAQEVREVGLNLATRASMRALHA